MCSFFCPCSYPLSLDCPGLLVSWYLSPICLNCGTSSSFCAVVRVLWSSYPSSGTRESWICGEPNLVVRTEPMHQRVVAGEMSIAHQWVVPKRHSYLGDSEECHVSRYSANAFSIFGWYNINEELDPYVGYSEQTLLISYSRGSTSSKTELSLLVRKIRSGS